MPRLSAAVLVTFMLSFGCDAPSGPPEMIPGTPAGIVPGPSRWAPWIKRNTAVFSGQYSVSSDPSICREGSMYTMHYTGLDPDTNRTILCAATSPDGLNWHEIESDVRIKGLVLNGKSGQWDENLESGFAVPWKGKTYLYYSGYRDEGTPAKGFPACLGLATSDDGKNFARVSKKPILDPSPGGHDCDAIYSAVIFPDGDQLGMVYVGHAYTNKSGPAGVFLLGATSKDGMKWTKRAEPVLAPMPKLPWTKDGVAEPALLKGPDGAWYLFFTGLKDEERVIGVARGKSPYGPWEINPAPIVAPSTGTFDEHQALAPAVLVEGNTVRMWYLGANKDGSLACGYAEAPWPIYSGDGEKK